MTVDGYQDEIDLRPYLLNIVNHWWQIALLVFLCVSAALAVSLIQPRRYEATATILATRSRAVLSLADQFPTVNEPVDYSSRFNAFQSIANSDQVVLETIQQIGEILPNESRQLEEFKKQLDISINGDIIRFSATAENPQVAAQIANEWAHQAILAINQAYRGESLPSDIHEQIQTARQEYQQAQATLESFTQENQISLLNKQLEEAEGSLDTLVKEHLRKISYFSQRQESMDWVIFQTEALKNQIEMGSNSSAAEIGDALAVLRARASTFSISPSFDDGQSVSGVGPSNTGDMILNLQLNGLEDQNLNITVEDLENLIKQAQAEKEKARKNLEALSQENNNNPESVSIQKTSERIQTLQTRLEEQQAKQRELTSNRDLNWKAYDAFLQKETELKNTGQTNNQVNLATEAVIPEKPTSRGTLQNIAIAGMLGLIIGIAWLLGSQWWQSLSNEKNDQV
jgi:succinoglycan biosynthesis transport protein ExoP